MFVLVNKNFLITQINEFSNFEESMKKLQQETILRNIEWCKNVYIVNSEKQELIYTSDGNNIYLTDLLNHAQKIIIYANRKITFDKNEYWVEFSEDKNNMNLVINEKKQQNVRFIETSDDIFSSISKLEISTDNKFVNSSEKEKITNTEINDNVNSINDINKEKDDEKVNQIIAMIEEVNVLYQKELLNMKKLQSDLKVYDTKLKKMEKTKKDEIINDIIRTQSEYRTWKKIKYGIKENADEAEVLKPLEELDKNENVIKEDFDGSIPILFLSKYKYIEKIQNNESIRKLLDEINQLDLNELYSNDFLPNNSIVQFCNKYMKLSKELHYHFDDHEWSYLEHEMNLNSTNKLGSNVVPSKKI